MVVNEKLNSLGALELGEESGEVSGLRSVTLSSTLEVLCARVGGGTTGNSPLVGPVSVDVVTEAGAARGRLTVLAPETVVGLSVDEACHKTSVPCPSMVHLEMV